MAGKGARGNPRVKPSTGLLADIREARETTGKEVAMDLPIEQVMLLVIAAVILVIVAIFGYWGPKK